MVCGMPRIVLLLLITGAIALLLVQTLRTGRTWPGHGVAAVDRATNPMVFWSLAALYAAIDLGALFGVLRAAAVCF